ncbi:hypothetical protein OA93_06350 [Flavobacterium sp. KMS]|uniref:HEPN domain-containing protein n=1 Tax=Flavobacterium sp. KMS TaxID=1566023 RepID=UPI000580B24F|nr:HEPN domain-containing protein [Flavobacterium sp. KMS]KIA99245.1 hypothetical protein OA93_06350 [Flavobacterium sp. KMS]
MVSLGEHSIESYAHIINADKTVLKLNSSIEKFGYSFIWVDATEFENNFSDIVSIPKSEERLLTIIIGREQHGISHELHNALVHNATFGQMFMHMEYPGIILLKKIDKFEIKNSTDDFLVEQKEFLSFYTFVSDLLLQLRLYKIGEVRCSQFFHITSITREISLRKTELSSGSHGDFTISDEEAEKLSISLKNKYVSNSLTELATKNFSIVYDIPDGRIRFITLMTCLESLFNLGKDQIAHTIARHLSIILSKNKEEFKENYIRIKKLYNMRNNIVHGGEYKGDLITDYLDLSEKVRRAINFCNKPDMTKEQLFENLNATGF